MGLKFLYYIDTSANWTLFTLGIICVPFGIGGMLLTTPIRNQNVSHPWYHATGIWVGMVFLAIAMMMPFARFHPTFLRIAVVLTFLAMIVAAVGLGVGIDEFTNWFENPTVKTFGSDTATTDSDVYVSQSATNVVNQFSNFDMFHKARVIVVMTATLLGICMLLFRIVTLGLVIFDEFTTRGYDVFTPEEEMMYQAMAEREMAGGEENEKQDYEAGYQPILYAGGRKGMKLSELADIKEADAEDDSYEEKMKEIRKIKDESSIYEPGKFVTLEEKATASTPTYTDEKGNLITKEDPTAAVGKTYESDPEGEEDGEEEDDDDDDVPQLLQAGDVSAGAVGGVEKLEEESEEESDDEPEKKPLIARKK